LCKILYLIVEYRNREEVDAFSEHVKQIHNSDCVVAVCNNTPDEAPPLTQRTSAIDILVSRPDNPGYLEGCWVALDAAYASGIAADWIAVSNTDLDLSLSEFRVLELYGDAPAVLAPRITEGPVEKNPHVLKPRSNFRLKLNHLATYTPILALPYLVASAASAKWRTGPPSTSLAKQGSRMFSPYGALILFNRAAMDSIARPRMVPLLAEEWAIATACKTAGVDILFEPNIHAIHNAHQTTGGPVTIARARMLSRAFRYIATKTAYVA